MLKFIFKFQFTLFIFLCHHSIAQKNIALKCISPSDSIAKIFKCKNETECMEKLSDWSKKKRSEGYLAFSIDSILKQEKIWTVYYYKGEQYHHVKIENGNLPAEVYNTIKTQSNAIPIQNHLNKVIRYYENHGYPFSESYFDSSSIEEKKISTKIYADKGSMVIVDEVKNINPDNKIHQAFLEHILQIKKNSLYSAQSISEIETRISATPYFELHAAPLIKFRDSFCLVILDIKEKKINRFNGLLGILPNSNTNNELLITGDVQVQLYNLFNRGIELGINWQKLQPYSQKLNLKFEFPYFFDLPFGLRGNFNLQKQDTSFLNLDWLLGVVIQQGPYSKIGGFIQSKSSFSLQVDTSFIITQSLPKVLNYTSYFGGLHYAYQKLDNLLIPKKGLVFDVEGSIGFKKISLSTEVTQRKNSEGISYKYLYDSIQLQPVNYQLNLNIHHYLPLSKILIWKSSLYSKVLVSKNITINENFRLGGNRTLRGFDEESILSPYYVVLSNELRILFNSTSYFYSFVDFASVKDIRYTNFSQNIPIGIGLGIALSTKGGIFGVSYAIGKQFDNPIDFKSAKLHFGYVNNF